MIGIFFFVFGIVFQRKQENYVLYLASGLLPYNFFSSGLLRASNSLVAYSSLVKQMNCRREEFVLAGVLGEFSNFWLSLAALMPLFFIYNTFPDWHVIMLLPIMIVMGLLVMGLGLIFSVLNVYFRDVHFLLAQGTRMLFFVSPILYPIDMFTDVSPNYGYLIFYLNPVAPILLLCRWALIPGSPFPPIAPLLCLGGVMFTLLALGIVVFRTQENSATKML